MRKVKAHSTTPRIPRAIALLNDYASGAGLEVRVSRISDPAWEPGLIVVEWSGPRLALFQAVEMPRSWRFPLKAGAICIPNREARGHGHFLRGRIVTEGDNFTMIARERAPVSIRQDGDIEIADYGDEVSYFGPKEALIAAGICTINQFPTKHANKEFRQWGYGDDGPARQWSTRRHQSGDYRYVIETEGAARERYQRDQENYHSFVAQAESEGWRAAIPGSRLSRLAPARIQVSGAAVANARNDAAFQAALSRMVAGARKNPD